MRCLLFKWRAGGSYPESQSVGYAEYWDSGHEPPPDHTQGDGSTRSRSRRSAEPQVGGASAYSPGGSGSVGGRHGLASGKRRITRDDEHRDLGIEPDDAESVALDRQSCEAHGRMRGEEDGAGIRVQYNTGKLKADLGVREDFQRCAGG